MNFETDVSITFVEDLRSRMLWRTSLVAQFLQESAAIPKNQWVDLLFWMLELEYDTFTELESGGSLVKPAYFRLFMTFQGIFRHIMVFIRSGVPLPEKVKPWSPMFKCKNAKIRHGFEILHSSLSKAVRSGTFVSFITDFMNEGEKLKWKAALLEVYRIDQ